MFRGKHLITPAVVLGSAVAYTLSQAPFGLFPLGWLFLAPLLWRLEGRSPGRAFAVFFAWSLVVQLLLLYWIPRVMVKYGNASVAMGIVGLLALALFLAFFSGLLGMLVARAPQRGDWRALFIPLFWVARDLLVEHVIGGFPWCGAGYSQSNNPWLVQYSEIAGIHLLTFIVVLLNVQIYLAWRRGSRREWLTTLGIVVLLHAGGWGVLRIWQARADRLVASQAGVIQPNVNHDQPLDYRLMHASLQRLFRESAELHKAGATFVVWPEFTVPIYPLQTPAHQQLFQRHAELHGPILAGFTDFQSDKAVYNSAMWFQADSILKYDKVHLTPFGEYIPFRRWLFFVKRITDEVSDFTPGTLAEPIITNRKLRLATPICYEVIFPELVRAMVNRGAEVIVTISNDSWFGDTSAPYQHLAMAAVRAVENRRDILRSTSNGISALLTAEGRIRHRLAYNTAGRFVAAIRPANYRTWFTRGGYLFPYFCAAATVVYAIGGLVAFFWKRRKRKNPL